VIYQQAPDTVIYQQPAPVIYHSWPRRVAVAPAYPPSVALGAAVINAAGRIASAAIMDSHRPEPYHYGRVEPNHFAYAEPNHYGRVEPNHFAHAEPNHFDRVESNHFAHAEPNHFAHAESNHNRGAGHERHS
jgi:hypothetical protein